MDVSAYRAARITASGLTGFDQRKPMIEHLWHLRMHQVMRAYLDEKNSSAARHGKFSLCLFCVLCGAYAAHIMFIHLYFVA